MSDIHYWLALTLLSDIGPITAKKLLEAFGTPERIFSADIHSLCSVESLTMKKASQVKEFSNWELVAQCRQALQEKDIRAIRLCDREYPEMLKETVDSPLVLYIKGTLYPEDRFAIAIVGSRQPTHYGMAVCESISQELASMGFTIVSGMARGIDSLAHRGALKAGNRTIAVLGSGVDVAYPPENKSLLQQITESGCVISEFPPGTLPLKEHFPRRNRLISGLSMGVLVVEATQKSGALITTKYALEQNREIFSIPGNIFSAYSAGTNELIKNGAVLVRNADDVARELAPALKGFIQLKNAVEEHLTQAEKKLCSFLSREPRQIDHIARESGFRASDLLGVLLGLELKGAVKQITGKRFYLA